MKHDVAIFELDSVARLKQRQARERLTSGSTPEEKQDNFEIAEGLQNDVAALNESIRILQEDNQL